MRFQSNIACSKVHLFSYTSLRYYFVITSYRAVFTWLSKVIEELVWFWFYYALCLASVFTLVLVLRQSSENRFNLDIVLQGVSLITGYLFTLHVCHSWNWGSSIWSKKITGQPLDYEQSPHLHQRATKERTRKVKGRSRSVSREARRVKAEGDSEMRRKKNALS